MGYSQKVMNNESSSSNPFEMKWNQQMKRSKTKRNMKATTQTRRLTSAVSGRNSFQDQRLGENNPKLSEEDRYLARLQRERSRGSKKRQRFNLSDMLVEDDALDRSAKDFHHEEFPTKDSSSTQYTLLKSNVEDESEIGAPYALDQIEERSGSDSEYPEEIEVSRDRTHREVMQEVMAKSKMYKAERQQVKAVDEEQREVLDRELPEIMSLLAKSTKVAGPRDTTNVVKKNTSGFNYEATFKELAMDRKAHATNRLKTVEEKEVEERDRLEELEQTRLSRMQGIIDSDDDGECTESDGTSQLKQAMLSQGAVNDIPNKSVDLVIHISDVPYVFEHCPADSIELSRLLCSTAVELRGVVIERLLKCFAISLDPSVNGPKLQRLLMLLLNRLKTLASSERKKLAEAVQEIEFLLEHIYRLSLKYTMLTVEWARDHLYESYHALLNGSNVCLSSCWDVSTVIIFRVLARLFPGSDVRHSVITPMFLLLSEALSPIRTKSATDFAMACYVCAIILEVSSGATRTSGQLSEFLHRGLKVYVTPLTEFAKSKARPATANCKNCNKMCINVTPLNLSDCFVDDHNDCKHLDVKIGITLRNLLSAAFFRGRLPCVDLVFASLPRSVVGNPQKDIRDLLRKQFEKQANTRKMLTMYTSATVFIPKALNPKLAAVNGVYRRHNKNRHKPSTMEQIQESAKRVRKALNKEERGYARDLRKEAMRTAQHLSEVESEKRAYSDSKSKELKLFLENQQATWNQAAKKQKQLSGKKW